MSDASGRSKRRTGREQSTWLEQIMGVIPIVRYMLLCDDWLMDGPNNRRVSIVGLIWTIHSVDDPPYPLFYREFCVFLALTEGRGQGEGQVVCVFEDTGE